MSREFEWDEYKAAINLRKHQVGFDEATTVFLDPLLYTVPDDEHSMYEQRFINIGFSARGRLLVVIHAERENELRIISSRRATAPERIFYELRPN